MPANFGDQLRRVFLERGQLCIGIDPHSQLLDLWGLPDSAQGVETFSRVILDSIHDRVGLVKPQIAFFERFGSAGYQVLEKVATEAKEAGLTVIADAKRGDIGTTMHGYLDAWFGKQSSMQVDALTVSPFLGLTSITDQLADYIERGKGVFALVATSNPEGASVQESKVGNESLAAKIFREIDGMNRIMATPTGFGSIGAVIGATLSSQRLSFLAESSGKTPILAPGFGAQGARLEDLSRIFGKSASSVIASVSRSVLDSGAQGVSDAVARANEQLLVGLQS